MTKIILNSSNTPHVNIHVIMTLEVNKYLKLNNITTLLHNEDHYWTGVSNDQGLTEKKTTYKTQKHEKNKI